MSQWIFEGIDVIGLAMISIDSIEKVELRNSFLTTTSTISRRSR